MDAKKRKEYPLATGLLDYFGDALMEVANCSWVGNQQHHPDKPLFWDKTKSTDEPDALLRHLKDRGTRDTDGVRHSAKVCWRALAMLQREIESERKLEDLPEPGKCIDPKVCPRIGSCLKSPTCGAERIAAKHYGPEQRAMLNQEEITICPHHWVDHKDALYCTKCNAVIKAGKSRVEHG